MDMYSWTPLSLNVLLLVRLVVLDAAACPSCLKGQVLQQCQNITCCDERYLLVKQGLPICELCTLPCSGDDDRHLIEIKKCGATFNRECHCKKGFYCSSKAQYTCRRCMPCPPGTFSNVTSLELEEHTCKHHTNCTSLGLVMISEGNNARDHQCGPVSTTPSTAIPTTKQPFSTPQGAVGRALEPTNTLIFPVTEENSSSAPVLHPSITTSPSPRVSAALCARNPLQLSPGCPPVLLTITSKSAPPRVTPGLSTSPPTLMPPSSNQTSASLKASPPPITDRQAVTSNSTVQSLWLLILACLLLLAALLAGFCRGKRLKKLQEYCGLSATKEKQKTGSFALTPQSREQPWLESFYSESREGAVPEEVGALYSGRQQITVDHSGGGESVKNTVGSIYIYSPGMVVLGANSSERREEPTEGQALISIPQQESLSEPMASGPWVRCPNGAPLVEGLQEEDHKLSYPVPATGK